MTEKTERHCRECDHCTLTLKTPAGTTGKQLAESGVTLFDNKRVVNIDCSLGLWNRSFGSLAVFDVSELPKTAAENCSFFSPEQE